MTTKQIVTVEFEAEMFHRWLEMWNRAGVTDELGRRISLRAEHIDGARWRIEGVLGSNQ